MTYIILIIAFAIIIWIVRINKKTFYWETIVEYLWKHVNKESEKMAYWINGSIEKKESKEDFDELVKYHKEKLSISVNLINSILDYVNNIIKKEEGEDTEEETFGYGCFDFDTILNTAKSNPNAFKKN